MDIRALQWAKMAPYNQPIWVRILWIHRMPKVRIIVTTRAKIVRKRHPLCESAIAITLSDVVDFGLRNDIPNM